MITSKNCGKENPDDAKFCCYCGERFAGGTASAPTEIFTFYELTDAELEALSPKRETSPAPKQETAPPTFTSKLEQFIWETSHAPKRDTKPAPKQETAPAPSPASDFEIAEENGDTVLKKYIGSAENVVIPDGVTNIGFCAFRNCKSLTSITIPESVTNIGTGAFYDCSSLTSITIPDRVTNIGNLAFYGCASLTSIEIPDGVKSIGWLTFGFCTSLTSVTMPNNLTSIGEKAFSNCWSLKSIIIPKSVTSIGDSAFHKCDKLTLKVCSGSYGERYAKDKRLNYQLIK